MGAPRVTKEYVKGFDINAIFDTQAKSIFDYPTQDETASMLTTTLMQSVLGKKIIPFSTAKEQPAFDFLNDDLSSQIAVDCNLIDLDKIFEEGVLEQQPAQEDDIFSMHASCNHNSEEEKVNPMDLTFIDDA